MCRWFFLFQHHYAQCIQRSNEIEESSGMYAGGDGMTNGPKNNSKALTGRMQALSREARSNQRRLLTAYGCVTASDLLKFNQLKVSCYLTVTERKDAKFRYSRQDRADGYSREMWCFIATDTMMNVCLRI